MPPCCALLYAGLARPGEQGAPPVLQLTLGMAPSEAPLPAEFVLQATSLDELGHQLLAQVRSLSWRRAYTRAFVIVAAERLQMAGDGPCVWLV